LDPSAEQATACHWFPGALVWVQETPAFVEAKMKPTGELELHGTETANIFVPSAEQAAPLQCAAGTPAWN
jgi:hypothetical protein